MDKKSVFYLAYHDREGMIRFFELPYGFHSFIGIYSEEHLAGAWKVLEDYLSNNPE